MNQVARTIVWSAAVGLGGLGAAFAIYTRRIDSAGGVIFKGSLKLEETPLRFRYLIQRRDRGADPSWGFYQRNVKVHDQLDLPSSSDHDKQVTRDSALLSRLSSAVFSSSAYRLELLLSGVPWEAPAPDLNVVGSSIGYLRLVERPSSNEAIFRYQYQEMDFLLYFGVRKCDNETVTAAMGFVELTGDIMEDLGSRVYVPLLLEAAVRKMEKT